MNRKLDTEQDLTLGGYRDISATVLGESSPAVKYLDDKISRSPNGREEAVLADESQMLLLLVSIHERSKGGDDAK